MVIALQKKIGFRTIGKLELAQNPPPHKYSREAPQRASWLLANWTIAPRDRGASPPRLTLAANAGHPIERHPEPDAVGKKKKKKKRETGAVLSAQYSNPSPPFPGWFYGLSFSSSCPVPPCLLRPLSLLRCSLAWCLFYQVREKPRTNESGLPRRTYPLSLCIRSIEQGVPS